MSNDKLSQYIGNMAKKRKIKLDDLAKECGISRTTLYRYVKGSIRIPATAQAAITKALKMTRSEQEEFHKLISFTAQDGSLISSRYVLDKFIFNNHNIQDTSQGIMFALQHKDTYLRYSRDIPAMFLEHSNKEGFMCNIKVINCACEDFRLDMQFVLTKLLSASKAVTVEHLLAFPSNDYLACAKNLQAIIAMFGYTNYQVFYDDIPSAISQSHFMNNVMLIESSWYDNGRHTKQHFILSYLPGAGNLSQCVVFDDEYIFRFFIENYNNVRLRYEKALLSNAPTSQDVYTKLELENDLCVLRSDIGYSKFPIDVYRNLLTRAPQSIKEMFNLTSSEGIEAMASMLKLRHQHSNKKGNIDVYSQDGLRRFAKTGYLQEYYKDMPLPTPAERRIILKTLREHLADKTKGYQLYISKKNIPILYSAVKDLGIMVGFYSGDNDILGEHPSLVSINNKMIANIFFDYAQHHIPAYHALSDEEALEFVDELIEMPMDE